MLLLDARRTVTNLICASNAQHRDWTADYRLYSQERLDPSKLFAPVLEALVAKLSRSESRRVVAGIDDTILRKTGRNIAGVGGKRDPLGPPFQTNLVRAQRWLQLSVAWPLEQGAARLLPVCLRHAPSPPKPPKNAPPRQRESYREALKQQNLNRVAREQIAELRGKLPDSMPLTIVGDGSFTHGNPLKQLPGGCVYIGRTRKDLALHHLPLPPGASPGGRPRSYGEKAPTPEQLRQDETRPGIEIEAFAAGRRHTFKVKTLGPLLWRKTGAGRPVRLLVIAPLAYRPRQGAQLLYRKPAYLLGTDPDKPPAEILQEYLWRWGLEVNFRDEKTLLGLGEAQVRTAPSNRTLPPALAAAYSLLWLSALQTGWSPRELSEALRPKWRRSGAHQEPAEAPCTGALLRQLRFEMLGAALRPATFSHFVNPAQGEAKPEKLQPSLPGMWFSAA
jgi:hypothetical protein